MPEGRERPATQYWTAVSSIVNVFLLLHNDSSDWYYLASANWYQCVSLSLSPLYLNLSVCRLELRLHNLQMCITFSVFHIYYFVRSNIETNTILYSSISTKFWSIYGKWQQPEMDAESNETERWFRKLSKYCLYIEKWILLLFIFLLVMHFSFWCCVQCCAALLCFGTWNFIVCLFVACKHSFIRLRCA